MAEMSKQEQVAFHRGALQTLAGEQGELIKLINATQQLSQMHISALKQLGVDYIAEIKKMQEEMQKKQPQQKGSDELADRLA